MDDFDSWNNAKKRIELKEKSFASLPEEGEVWNTILGKNIGYEQNGVTDSFVRPCLIIKKFNSHMYWVVPLSRQQKKFDFYFNFLDHTDSRVAAILAQLRLISVKRLERKLYDMPPNVTGEIKTRLKSYLN